MTSEGHTTVSTERSFLGHINTQSGWPAGWQSTARQLAESAQNGVQAGIKYTSTIRSPALWMDPTR